MINYTFTEHKKCPMCLAGIKHSKVLGQRSNSSQGFNPKNITGISVSVLKCKKCGLIYPQPLPTPKKLEDHYGTPAEDYWNPEYFKIDKNYFTHQINIAKDLLNIKTDLTALDIGAGIGKASIALKKSGFKTTSIEPSKAFYEKAISQMGIEEKNIYNLKVEDADFEQNTFDFITFGAVFEHLYNPYRVLEQTLNWLKPGGIMHIEVPSSNWLMSKISNFYFKIRGTNYVTNLSPMHNPFHIYEFGLDSFIKNAKQMGYEISKHSYSVCTIYHVPKILHPFLKFLMKKTNTGMQLTVYLKKK